MNDYNKINLFKLKVATITEQNGQKRKIFSSFSTFRVRTQYAQKRAKLVFRLFTISQEKARGLSEMNEDPGKINLISKQTTNEHERG